MKIYVLFLKTVVYASILSFYSTINAFSQQVTEDKDMPFQCAGFVLHAHRTNAVCHINKKDSDAYNKAEGDLNNKFFNLSKQVCDSKNISNLSMEDRNSVISSAKIINDADSMARTANKRCDLQSAITSYRLKLSTMKLIVAIFDDSEHIDKDKNGNNFSSKDLASLLGRTNIPDSIKQMLDIATSPTDRDVVQEIKDFASDLSQSPVKTIIDTLVDSKVGDAIDLQKAMIRLQSWSLGEQPTAQDIRYMDFLEESPRKIIKDTYAQMFEK